MRFCVQMKLYNISAVCIYDVMLFVLQQGYRGFTEKSDPTQSTTEKALAQRRIRFRVQPTSDNFQEVEENIKEVTSSTVLKDCFGFWLKWKLVTCWLS